MDRAEEYRQNAVSSLRAAQRTTDLAARSELLVMARAWQKLADQAERNDRTYLIYEPPLKPASAQQPVTQQQQQTQPKED